LNFVAAQIWTRRSISTPDLNDRNASRWALRPSVNVGAARLELFGYDDDQVRELTNSRRPGRIARGFFVIGINQTDTDLTVCLVARFDRIGVVRAQRLSAISLEHVFLKAREWSAFTWLTAH
jgi:hypothetical protein